MSNQHTAGVAAHQEAIIAAFNKHAGNISAISREVGLSRSAVRKNLAKMGMGKKPLAGGKQRAAEKKESLPIKGSVKRFILTSAQNNTFVHNDFWSNLIAMAAHYDAQIMVGTFTYNQNNFGKLAVKQGTKKAYETELWYDPKIVPFTSDKKIELAPGLVWCGNQNIL